MRVKIAVIIINFNSEKYLKKALQGLVEQSVPPDKVIVLDNNSTEFLTDNLMPSGLEVQIIRSEKNLGFAGGNNLAAQYVGDCDWIALLNPDTYPENNWLETMHKAIKDFPDYTFFASKLLKMENAKIFDGTGDEYHVSGRAWRRDFQREDFQQREKTEEIFAPCAAAAFYRKDIWQAVNGFDENYFCYFEDVDLAFRLNLLGYRCRYIPDSVVYHHGSAVTERHSDFYIYHGHRNMVWTYVKNMPGFLFWLYLPYHISLNLAAILFFILKGRGKIILKSKWDAWKDLPRVLKQRKYWQSRRQERPWALRKKMAKSLPWQKSD